MPIKIICKNVNEFKAFCNKRIEELKKLNKENEDLKNANGVQAGLINKLQASKKETEAKLTACQARLAEANIQIGKLKQSL